jgi:predicted transcriptional regulator
MSLYEILVNRECIWILKELYEAEVINKKIYTIRSSDLKRLGLKHPERYILILEKNGLLHVDDTSKDVVISLNQKGKEFFKMFDKMKIHVESQVKIVEEQPMARIEYDLTNEEKKALLTVHKISQIIGDELPIKSLIIDNKKQEIVFDKLQKLNLIAKVKSAKGKGMTIKLTPAGKKVILNEFSEKLK